MQSMEAMTLSDTGPTAYNHTVYISMFATHSKILKYARFQNAVLSPPYVMIKHSFSSRVEWKTNGLEK